MGVISAARTAVGNLEIVGELFRFFWGNKRRWLLPVLGALFLFGALIILAQSSAIAPFTYTFF